jgi:hypothetical protein
MDKHILCISLLLVFQMDKHILCISLLLVFQMDKHILCISLLLVFQMDKHILCITLLLGMTNDEDHNVQAAAVRALGVYVLYPNLREVMCTGYYTRMVVNRIILKFW